MEKQLRIPNQNTKRKPTEGSTLPETIDDDDDAFVEETNLTRQRNRKLRPIPQNDSSSSSDELQESDHRHSKRLKRTKELKPKQRTISVLSECEYEQVQHLKEIVEEGIRRYEEYIDSDIELDSELVFKNHVDGVDADLTSDIENAEDEHNIVNVDTFVQDNAQINIKVGDSSVGTSPAGDRHTIHRNLRAENVEIKAEKLGTQNSGDKNVSIINMKESEDRSGKRRFRNKKQGLATRGHEEDENVRIISGKEDDNNCVVMVHEKQTVGGLKVTVTPTFTKTSELEVDNRNKNDLDAGAVTFTKTPELENNRKVDLTGTKVEVKAMDKKEQVSVEKSSLFMTGRKDTKDYNVTFQGRDQTPSKRNKVTVNLKAETNSVKSPNVDHSKLNLDLKRKPDDAFSPKVPRKSTKQEPRPSQLNLKGSLNKSKAFDGEEKTIKIKNFTEEVTLRSVKKEPSASSPRKSPMSPTKKRPSLPSPSDPINNIAKKLTTEISSDKTIKDNSNEKNDSKENNVMLEVAPRTVDEGVKFADPTTGSSTAQITGSPLHSDQSKSKINFKVDRKDSSLVPGTGEPSQGTSQQTFKTDKRNNSTSANINSKFSEEDDIVTTSTPTMINYDDSTVTTPSSIHLSSKDELQKVNQEVKSSSEIENKEVLQRDNAPIKLSVGSESTKDTGSQDIQSKPVTDINDSPVARSPSPFSLKSSTSGIKPSDGIDGKSDEKVTEKPSKPDETVKTQQRRSSRRRREEKDPFDIKLKQTVQLNKLDTVDSLTFKARDEVDQRMKTRTPSPTVPDKVFTKQETDNDAAHMLSTSSSKADNISSSSAEIATSKNDSNVSTSTSRSNKQKNSLKAHPTQKLKSPTLSSTSTSPKADSEVPTPISTSGKPIDSSKIRATSKSPTLLADVIPPEANSEVLTSISTSGNSKDSSKIRATSKSPTLLADVIPPEANSQVSTPTPKSNKPKDSSKIRATPKQKTLLADVTPSEADNKVSTSTPKSNKQHATVVLQSKSPTVAASPEDGTKASISLKSHKDLLSSTTIKQDVQHDLTDEIRGKYFSKSSSSVEPSPESDSKSTLEPQIAVTSNALAHHNSTAPTIDLPMKDESSTLKPIVDEVTQKSSLKAQSNTESSLKTTKQKQVDVETDHSKKMKKTQGDVSDEPNFKTRVDEGSGRNSFEDQSSIIGIDNGKPDLLTQRTEPNDRKAESSTLSFDVPSLPMDIESTMETIDKKPFETPHSSSIPIHLSKEEHFESITKKIPKKIPTKVELKGKPAHIVEEVIMAPVKSRMVEEIPEHLQVLEDTSLHVTSTSKFKDLEEADPTQQQPNEDLRMKSPASLDEARSTEKASESQKDSDKEPGEITTINKKPTEKDTENLKLDLSLSSGSSLKSPITNRRNRFTEQQVKPVNEAPKSRTLDEKRRDTDSPRNQDMEQSSLLKSPSATRRNRFTEQPANPGDKAPNSPKGIDTSNIGEVQSLMSLDKTPKSPAVDRKPKSKDSSKTVDVEIPSMESADETPKSPAVDQKPKSKDSLKTMDVEIPSMEPADETPKSPAVDQKPKSKDSLKTMDVEIPSMEPADETPKSPAVDQKPKSKDSLKTMDVEIPSMEPADETPKSPAVDQKPKSKDSSKTVDVEIPSMESADETPKSPAVNQKPKSNESSKTIDVEIPSMEPADETPKSPVVDRRPKSKDSLKTVCMEIPSIEPVDKAPTSPTVDQKPKSNESSKTGDEKQQQSLKSPTTPRKNRFTDQLNKTKPGPKSFIADRTEPLLNKPGSTDKETLSSNKKGDKSGKKVPISHEEVLKSPKPEQSPFTKKPASAEDETLTSPLNTVNSEAEIPKSPASPVSKQKLSTESQSNSIKDESSKSQTGSQRLSPENAPKTYKESLNTPIDDQMIRSTEKQENTSKDKNLKPSTFSSGKTTSSDKELIKSPSKRKEEDSLDDEGLKLPAISSRKSASSNEESPEKQEDTMKARNLMSPTISTGTNEELIKSPTSGRRRRRKSPEQRSRSEEEILAAKYESLDQIKDKQLSEDIVQHMEHIMGGIDIALIEHGSRPMHESSGRDSWYKNEGLGDHVAGLLSMVDQFIDEEDHEFNKSYEAIKKSNAQLEKEREKDKTSLSKIAERAKLEKDLSPDYESFSPYSIMKKRNSEQHSSFTFKDVVIGDAGREEKADTVHDDEYCVIELGGPSVDAVSPTKGIAKAERKSVKRSTFIQRLMQSEDKGLSFDDVENVTSGEEERTVVLEAEVTKDDGEVVADDEKPTIDINKMTLKESSLDPEVSSDCPEKYQEQSSVSNEVNSPTPVEEPKVTGPANSKKIAGDEANRLPLCDEKKTAEPIAEISEPKEKMQQHEVKSKTPDERSSEHVVKLAETKRKINEFQIPISAKEPKAVQSTVESSESKKRSKRSNFIQRLMESEEIQSADENELSDDQMDDDKFLYARREQSVKHLVFDSTGKEVSKKQEQETSQLQVSSQIQDGQEIDESSKAIVTLGGAEPTVLESMANQEVATRQDSLLQEEAINEDVSETKKSTSPMSPKERMLLKQKMRIRQESIDETLDDIFGVPEVDATSIESPGYINIGREITSFSIAEDSEQKGMLDGTPVSPDVATAPIESLEQMGHVHIDQGTTKFDITKESEKKVILDSISAFSDVDPTSPIDACVPKSESETESNTPVSNGVIGILDSPDIVYATIESPGYVNIVREMTPSSLAKDSERKEIKVVTPAFTDVDPELIKVEMTTTLVSKPSISHEEVSSPTALSLDDVQEDDTDVPRHTEYVNIDVGVTPLTITEDAEVVEDSELVEDPVVPETKNVEQVRRTSENESTTQIIEPDSIVGEDPKIDVGFVKESEPQKVNLICTVEQASEQPKNEDTDLEIQGDITILEVTDTVDSFDEVDLPNMEEFDQIIDDITIPDCDQDTPDPLTIHNVVVDSPEDIRKNETSKNHVELKKTLLQDQQIVIEEKITVESNTREVFAENDNLLTNTQQSDDSITAYTNREKEENCTKSLHHNNDLIITDGSLLANKSLNTTTVAQDESIKLRSDKEQNYHVKIETGELAERQDNRYDYLSRVSNRDENDSRENEINAQAKQWIEVAEQDDNRPENKFPEVENQEDAVSKEEDYSVKKELISKTRNPTENKHHIEDSTIVTKQKQHSLTNEQVNHSTISQEGFNNQDNPLTHQLDDNSNDFNNGKIEVVTAARIKEDSTFNGEYNPVYIKTDHQKTTTDVLIDSSNILTFDNKNTGLQDRESRLDQRYTEGKPDLLSENIIKENRSEFTVIESSLKNLTDKKNGSIDNDVVNDSNRRNNRRGKPLSDKKFETTTKRVVGSEETSWIRVSADSSESVKTAHQNKVETKVEPASRQKILAINSIVSLKGDSIDFKEYLLKHSDTVFNVRESNEFRGKDLENMTETELIVEPLLDGQESDVIKLKGSLQTVDDLLSGAVSSSNGMGSNQEVMAVIQDAVNEFTADIGSGESRKNISSEVNIVFPHSPSAQKRTISFIFKEDQEQRFHSEIETDIANKSPLASPTQHVSMLSIDDSSNQPGMKRSGSFLSVANVPELNASGKHVDTHAQSDKQWSYNIRQKNEGTCQLSIQVIMDSNILERFETETVEFKNILKNFEHDGCIGEWVLVNCTTREIEIFIQLLKELLEKEKLRELDNDTDKHKFCYIL